MAAMPKIEMNPIAADTEKWIPVMSSASTPPGRRHRDV